MLFLEMTEMRDWFATVALLVLLTGPFDFEICVNRLYYSCYYNDI